MRRSDVLPIAFVVPLQGPTGMYGPSCLACGELAVEQLNARNGIAGRRVELIQVDAGRPPEVVAEEVGRLVDSGRVEAVAGWHISAVRVALTRRIGGRVVYAFAAMHEGGDDTPGVFMLGERPVNQLLPAARWLREHHGARRWVVVGNDYVYPRVTGAVAQEALDIMESAYVALGTSDFTDVINGLKATKADGVIMLLMGQDAVHFNRQFARAGLSEDLLRLSTAIEENTLLGAGPGANHGVYAAAAYFDGLSTVESNEFAQQYYARFGPFAPALNAVGESCYEAIRFLARLGEISGSIEMSAALPTGHFYDSPRGLLRLDGNLVDQDVYLAAADGLEFRIEEQIAHTY
ncbi:substrate-binding domain-containing protein [Kribbella sp. NBC_00709]|uniref:substrate-binding domain-containing protein n=1 Tax=Kribbella sp. NBC_00709 TaxID=2975972 RepID=UPI002E2DF3CA|nr:substrate-binding domain-containing protein [Kribbella sp. NBC_00709]